MTHGQMDEMNTWLHAAKVALVKIGAKGAGGPTLNELRARELRGRPITRLIRLSREEEAQRAWRLIEKAVEILRSAAT